MNGYRIGRVLGALLVAPAVAAACGTGEAEEASSLQTVEVERGSLRITAEATGTVEPIRMVEVKSKAGGEILELQSDVGDAVEPGALLARIDPRDVRNRYDQAMADLEVARARADIAQNQLGRQEQLHESGVITDQELENARLETANARANLIKAETNLELAELQLNDVNIRAPMKGTILQKNVEEGQVIQSAAGNVSGGTTLFIMANLDQMQVRTLLAETDMGDIQPGMSAQVTVEAYPDRAFTGVVEKVEPQAVNQQNVTMFPVIIHLDNRGGVLKPGMNAEVEILIDRASDVVLVPNGAIVQPEDVVPAAMALGLDVDQLELARFRGAGRFAGRAGGGTGDGGVQRPGGGRRSGASGEPGADPGRTADGAAGGDGAGPSRGAEGAAARGEAGGRSAFQAFRDSVQQRVQAGEIDQDSARALFRRRIQAAGRGGGREGAGGVGSGLPGGAPEGRQTRNAVVFVVDSAGVPSPELIQIGLSDWDFTQVLSGVEEGDRLAVVGAAQLQARQQEFMERFRRRGGPF